MRIVPINGYYRNLQPQTVQSFGNFKTVKNNLICEKIKEKGFKLFKEIELINPQGQKIKGYSFIKETKNNEITSLITDDKFYELGQANVSLGYSQRFMRGSWCVVKNLTESNPEIGKDFLKPITEFSRTSENGKYKHVATQGYNTLIDYIKQNHPNIKTLDANIKSQQSWDFHKKYGFKSYFQDKYDLYAMFNKLSFEIN